MRIPRWTKTTAAAALILAATGCKDNPSPTASIQEEAEIVNITPSKDTTVVQGDHFPVSADGINQLVRIVYQTSQGDVLVTDPAPSFSGDVLANVPGGSTLIYDGETGDDAARQITVLRIPRATTESSLRAVQETFESGARFDVSCGENPDNVEATFRLAYDDGSIITESNSPIMNYEVLTDAPGTVDMICSVERPQTLREQSITLVTQALQTPEYETVQRVGTRATAYTAAEVNEGTLDHGLDEVYFEIGGERFSSTQSLLQADLRSALTRPGVYDGILGIIDGNGNEWRFGVAYNMLPQINPSLSLDPDALNTLDNESLVTVSLNNVQALADDAYTRAGLELFLDWSKSADKAIPTDQPKHSWRQFFEEANESGVLYTRLPVARPTPNATSISELDVLNQEVPMQVYGPALREGGE